MFSTIPPTNSRHTALASNASLPVTEVLTNRALKHGVRFDDSFLLVSVQHGLRQTPDLFRGLNRLGLPFENILWLGKEYSTSKSIEQELSDLKVQVIPTSQSALGRYDECFKCAVGLAWEAAQARLCRGRIKAILVLDDGGQLISAIPPSIREGIPLIAVEQTMSGVRIARTLQTSVPVIEVGSSAAKTIFESPLIAEAVVRKTSSVVFEDSLPKTVGIVGYGAIGKALSKFLTERCKAKVLVTDPAMKSREELQSENFVPLSKLLSDSKFIFGCTGTDITADPDFPVDCLEGVTLASCSSRDIEFQTLLRRLSELQTTVVSPDGAVRCELQTAHFSILRRGFPVNFDGGEESVPTKLIQLTTGLLFSGLIQAREMFAKGLYGERSTMLDPYLQAGVLTAWNREAQGLTAADDLGLGENVIRYCRSPEALAGRSEGALHKLTGCNVMGSGILPTVRQEMERDLQTNLWRTRNVTVGQSIVKARELLFERSDSSIKF